MIEKKTVEERPFLKIKDSLKKIIISYENIESYYYDKNGILIIGLWYFLVNRKV